VDNAFSVTINANGTITVIAYPSSPTTEFVNLFTILTNSLNTSLPVENNPFMSFNLAPTTADYAFQNIPTHVLRTTHVFPMEPTDLLYTRRGAIGFATGATIKAARFLKPKPEDRTKATMSVVISITPDQALLLKDSIRLISCIRTGEIMFYTSLTTEYRNCCKFRHPSNSLRKLPHLPHLLW
jgi:hypothetical protein